jgi:hypothetical protein
LSLKIQFHFVFHVRKTIVEIIFKKTAALAAEREIMAVAALKKTFLAIIMEKFRKNAHFLSHT